MHQLQANLLHVCGYIAALDDDGTDHLFCLTVPTAVPPPVVEPPPRAPAPWRVKETAPAFVPDEPDQGLGEDDMAIDDD
jgi:hypothetical protein